jgi:hypothetical protein
VVIELKVGKFKPEYVSKMNFYLNAVDEQLRLGDDRESVGIILCAGGDAIVANARAPPRLRADRCLDLEDGRAAARVSLPSRSPTTCRRTSASSRSSTRSGLA